MLCRHASTASHLTLLSRWICPRVGSCRYKHNASAQQYSDEETESHATHHNNSLNDQTASGKATCDESASAAQNDQVGQASDLDTVASRAKKQSLSLKTSKRKSPVPPRLLPATSEQHSDLASFEAYATRAGLKPSTTVYKGTFYEYTVAKALQDFNFRLLRTGRSNDLGIDLVGHWDIPAEPFSTMNGSQELRILVQCKAVKPQPAMVRELEGAYAGAPVGWRDDDVLALLVTSEPATKGVREAVQRSRWPLGVVQVTVQGVIRQFLWNSVAARMGLEGLGVTVRYGSQFDESKPGVDSEHEGSVPDSLTLTWMGRPWNSRNQ